MRQWCPPQAKTQFEQKILKWVFFVFFMARTKRRPPAWLADIGRQILFERIVFLVLSMSMIWFLISVGYLSHQGLLSFLDILIYLRDHSLELCGPATPRSIVELFFKWLGVATIVFVGPAFIMLRVKNWPLEFRLGFACLMVALPAYANPINYFSMPCWVSAGMYMSFPLLSSTSAIALLVCSMRVKKWPPEMFQNVELPIEESNG